MSSAPYNLAIETSSRIGSVTLGRGDVQLVTRELPPQERHRVDLLPVIDELCRAHQVKPADIREIYISHGPGSFTGLRIGITTAKTLALITGARLVAVPTLEVVAMNVPMQLGVTLIVALNMKKDTVYAGVFEAGTQDEHWQLTREPALTSLPDLLATITGPVLIVGEKLPLESCLPARRASEGGSVPGSDKESGQIDQRQKWSSRKTPSP
ncbi:MAG: tRNA (adenosine(37)-N6)-threonylcarbamoyltransferase complex dimerization subunit type 1 TsaB [Phycisphaerales bacterium]|nr:tRNA (adenosine(37)-N6)-threonylcarbamoyltransferase complex dimerization subunit type 1 TsaB [Phycisphaerales bacterium]